MAKRKEQAESYAVQQATPLQQRADTEMAMLDILATDEEIRASQPPKIGSKEVLEATQTLRRYKEGKARLEAKIIANEEFWKLRQWNYHSKSDDEFRPASAWLWSCIQSRYSDVMDSYPTCNFLPRQADDKAEATKLSDIVPIILEQNKYEETYSDVAWYMLKQGGSAQGIFWDGSKNNGLGDISIKRIDFINLFWESGITDIQESDQLFNTELVSNKILEQRYPQTKGHLNGKKITLAKYLYDDNVNTEDKSVVVDWYYHTEYNGHKVLQYCKFVDDIVLYATENDTTVPTRTDVDPETGMPLVVPTGKPMSERGLYDHALYPFVCQSLYPIEGSLVGYGLTDIGRDTQMQIDVMNKAIVDNTVAGATPRYFVRGDGGVNMDEFKDTTKPFVHVEGNIGDENVRPIESNQLSSTYVQVLDNKVGELKYVTSNQDSNNGVAPSGVTAASAIAALQEAAGKNARSTNKAFYRAYRDVIYQVVELIRQFYDVPRTFRIVPDSMGEQFVQYSNAGLKPQPQIFMGQDMGFRKPEFDIEVTAEKSSPYKKMEQNELALNFYQQGIFNPEMADQATACLEMMDFQGKEQVLQRVQENNMTLKLLLQYQQIALTLAQKYDPMLAEQMAQGILEQSGQPVPMEAPEEEEIQLEGEKKENPRVTRARANALGSTQVR